MESQNPESINQWRIDSWFSDFNPDVLRRFKDYHTELVKFNKTLNLVSAKTVPVSDALHFADSILASRVIAKSNPKIQEIYDLGSGNGFPGLIFAILNPSIKVNLIDSDQRKCEFMKHIVNTCKIQNANIQNIKVEDLKDGSVMYAMSRGFASISKAILLLRKAVPKGGMLYHLKGEQWAMEVSEIPTQLCSLWNPALVGEYRLPIGEIKFAVIRTDKIA